jgi:hypothetical protein
MSRLGLRLQHEHRDRARRWIRLAGLHFLKRESVERLGFRARFQQQVDPQRRRVERDETATKALAFADGAPFSLPIFSMSLGPNGMLSST